jgi:predicted NBD/HSP70 family sugar kinase
MAEGPLHLCAAPAFEPLSGPGAGPILPLSAAEDRSLREQAFQHVRAAGQAARTDIARALGISAGSVTALTAALIQDGFLRQVEGRPREGTRDSGRGRPPVALEVVAAAARVIGVKLGDDRLSAVMADFAGQPVARLDRMIGPRRHRPEEIVEEIAALSVDLALTAGHAPSTVAAVGLGLSGIIDHEAGVVAWSPVLEGRDLPLARAVSERLGCPAFIDNDANMLTLAELWYGAGRETTDFAVVTVEQGVGMGLVLGSKLFRGSRGMGLELGHTKVHLDGALCRCGRRGCLEAYLADYALAREAATALDRPPPPQATAHSLLDPLYARATAGDAVAAAIFRRAGRYLALGLSNVAQLIDPPLILLSGARMRYHYLYAEEMLAEMERLLLSEGRAAPRVEVRRWDDGVWARGAAALALSAVTAEVLSA